MLQQWHKPPPPGKCLELTTVNQFLKTVDIHDSNLLKNENRAFENASWVNDLINYGIKSSNHSTRRANIQTVFHDHGFYTKDNLMESYMAEVNSVTDVQIVNIEKATKFQSLNKNWFRIRESRITASIVHKVIRTARKDRFASGYARTHILSRKNSILMKVPAIKWGVQNEKNALAQYSRIVGEQMDKCGIFIHNSLHFLAASPDAINKKRNLLVEIKCPFNIRFELPDKAPYLSESKSKDQSLKIPEYLTPKHLSKKHEYFTQIQFQLFVTGLKVCDFVVWTTMGIYIEKIYFDKKFVQRRLPFINEYYKRVFIPMYLNLKN